MQYGQIEIHPVNFIAGDKRDAHKKRDEKNK
jgi:hypothetical protein